MPVPATVDELLDLVQKSGVADPARLKAYLARLAEQKAVPAEPRKAADMLVRDGLITNFQADNLLQGKWRRFSIGKYKVLEKLGAGGMGQVFLCEHKLMRRRVAVKVLPTAKAEDRASLDRFFREARAVAAVDHPNIVRAYDIDQDENLHFLVMEYVDGTNLQDLIKKTGPLDVVRACHYVYGAAVGLQHAHEMGLVHRDIKPGNILLDRSGVVKILDLGLARFFHDSEDNLTKQYDENILGTADYLSPEQAEDSHTVDIRTDLYSLGATFYFLLTGRQPFPEGSITQKLIWHRSRDPQPVQELRPDVPDELVAVVRKMMAKKPDARYQTPAEVMAVLAPWVATPIPPPPEREMPQLSPAVAGGVAGRSMAGSGGVGPRSIITPAPFLSAGVGSSAAPLGPPSSLTGAPTIVSGGSMTPTPAPTLPPPAEAGNGVWESLGETPALTPEDTARPSRTPEPKSRTLRAASGQSNTRTLLFLGLAAAVVVLTGAGAAAVYFAFFNTKPAPVDPTPHPATGARRLVVSKAPPAGTENTFPTLARALTAAASGDTIVIADPTVHEPTLRLDPKKRDLTIESGVPGGKPAVIEFTAAAGGFNPTTAMLEVGSTENVRIRDIEFDGKGVADYGVQLSGLAPGVTFERVTVRGVKKLGFRLLNAAGDQGRPITLDRVRVLLAQTSEAGVKVEAQSTMDARRIVIRNSRFEGQNRGSGVRFDGVVTDAEVSNNRFYRLDSAVSFGRAPEGQVVRVLVAQNTVLDAKVGLHFTAPPPGGVAGNKYEVTANRNYFAKTATLAKFDGPWVPPLASSENGHRRDSAVEANHPGIVPFPGIFPLPNTLPVTSSRVDTPALPAPDPRDDETFLRFPPPGPIVGKVRVGAE
jgi:serine/threonine protein kinase